MTRLESFIKRHGIKPSHLAKLARISRNYLRLVRHARREPTRHVVARLTIAAAIILGRLVSQSDLFDLWEIGRDKGGTTQGRRGRKAPRRRKPVRRRA